MAAGREIVRTGALLSVDPFSMSAGGRPWIDVHWIFQLATFAIHRFGGLAALVLVKCLLVGIGALALQATVRRHLGPRLRWHFVSACLIALFCVRHLIVVRPIVVTLLFLAFFFRALERFRCEGRPQALQALPLLQIVWVNVQGLFALGPLLVGAYLLGGILPTAVVQPPASAHATPIPSAKQRHGVLAMSLALCIAASCVTPYGLRAFALATELFLRILPGHLNVYAANIAENLPPMAREGSISDEFWHLKWFVALLAASFLLAGRRVVLAHAILVTGLVALALAANRNVLLLYWLATPIAVMNVAPKARSWLRVAARGRIRAHLRGLSFVVVAAPLVLIGAALRAEPSFAEPAPFRFPVQSARMLAAWPQGGTLFAADHYGGYLIWELFPPYKPYIDTRLVLRTPEEFSEYLGLADHPERFDNFQKRHGFDYVLLPTAYPDRYLDLVAHLYASSHWKLVFTDGTECMFARLESGQGERWDLGAAETTDAVVRALDDRFGGSPRVRFAARIQFAALDVAVGEYRQVERILGAATDPAADGLRARVRLASGDLAGAEAIGRTLLARDADDVRSLNLMAIVSLRQGQVTAALQFLRRALAVDPFDSEAERLLAQLEEHVR
jgi:tetratricopeptide (TPR) repeat protein